MLDAYGGRAETSGSGGAGADLGAFGAFADAFGVSSGGDRAGRGPEGLGAFGIYGSALDKPIGFWGGLARALSGWGEERAQRQARMFGSQSDVARGLLAGHALGLVTGVATMGLQGISLSSFAKTGWGIYGHAKALSELSPGTGGTMSLPGIDGGAERLAKVRAVRSSQSFGAPEESVSLPARYTETKEYLGAQRQIQAIQEQIRKLGIELEAIEKKRAELAPKRREMVGRIPLVHTELASKEPKALTAKGRERMLMSHRARRVK